MAQLAQLPLTATITRSREPERTTPSWAYAVAGCGLWTVGCGLWTVDGRLLHVCKWMGAVRRLTVLDLEVIKAGGGGHGCKVAIDAAVA